MSAIDQIRAILADNPDIEVAELKNVMKKCKRTSALQKDMRELVKKHGKTALSRLRKELKSAHEYVHKTDENSEGSPVPETPYRKFVKEQTAIMLSGEGIWKNMPQAVRMVEIGKRWKAQKMGAISVEVPLVESEPEIETPKPKNGKRVAAMAAGSSRPKRNRQ